MKINRLNNYLYMIIDGILNLLSWIIAFGIYKNFNQALLVYQQYFSVFDIIIISAISVINYMLFGIYKSLWLHSGLGSAIRLSVAVFSSTLITYVFIFVITEYWLNLFAPLTAFYLLLSSSLFVRIYKKIFALLHIYFKSHMQRYINIHYNEKSKKRSLIIGAGDTAYYFIRNELKKPKQEREIICIIENDPKKHGYTILDISIMGDDEKIPYFVKELNINEIIIALPNVSPEHIKRIIKLTPTDRCVVRRINGLSGNVPGNLNDINISDILGREESIPDSELVDNWVQGKTVLITGGGGSIGSQICNELLQHNIEKLIVYDISENNAFNLFSDLNIKYGSQIKEKVVLRIGSIQDPVRLNSVFEEFKPNIVFHAAAYKHVPFMEESPRLAFTNNTIGTLITARFSYRHNVERFVLVSTDKAVNPANVMGATKRLSELVVLGLNAQNSTEYVCVRFGNVLDSNGSVVPTFKSQIAAGGPVTLTHPDITRYFMTIPEAAQLVLEAGAIAKGGEIFVLDMGQPIKIKDLAENLILLAGLTPDVDIEIKVTGLRPGEKLYEELLLNTEGLEKTPNNKIFVVQPPFPEDFHILIQNLLKYMEDNSDSYEVYRLIEKFVPEYMGKFPKNYFTNNPNNPNNPDDPDIINVDTTKSQSLKLI